METRISKIENNDVIQTALTISGTEYIYGTPFKKVYIHNDSVYQVVPEKNTFAIYYIPWSSKYETRITSAMVETYNKHSNEVFNIESNSATRSVSVSRDEALDRAYKMCYTGWHYNANTMHTQSTGTTESPEQLGTTSKYEVGIPYCWGGMNGLDTATYSGSSLGNMQNFTDCLTSGKTAGNINTSKGSWTSTTFGIDCSGFICAAFKIGSKEGTGTLGNYFSSGNWNNVQAGDVAISLGHHTFLVSYVYTSETSGFYMLGTYESTVDGSPDRAKGHSRYYADVINTYSLYTY